MIEARIVKGFRDALPEEEYLRSQIIGKLSHIFYQQGYQAIDTPILEYTQTLLGKSGGETEKQIFRFKDAGDRDVAMRFDLTVPLARYVAMHKEEIGLPFKRYHIAKVWRGEKPQRGRFREFYQCDFDLVGADSPASDLDILLTAYYALSSLGVHDFIMEVNHRGVLLAYFEKLGIIQESEAILRAVDKVDKVGWDVVTDEMSTICSLELIDKIKHFMQAEESVSITLSKMKALLGEETPALERLEQIFTTLDMLGLQQNFTLNPRITRGLDYYTGMVFETFLTKDRALGSICSGGRYDNLLSLYTKDKISGVGGSIGLDRLLSADHDTTQLEIIKPLKIMVYHTEEYAKGALLLPILRGLDLVAEIYPEKKKIDNQTKYALRKGINLVIFVEGDGYTLRDLDKKESTKDLSVEALISLLKEKYIA